MARTVTRFVEFFALVGLVGGCIFPGEEDDTTLDDPERDEDRNIDEHDVDDTEQNDVENTEPADTRRQTGVLEGTWNLRIDFDKAEYIGGAVFGCDDPANPSCGEGSAVDIAEFVDYLCEEHDVCFAETTVAEFEPTAGSDDPRHYTLDPNAPDGGSPGRYFPRLDFGVFAIDMEIAGMGGEGGGVAVGYADQLLINTSRPEIDVAFEGDEDGRILIELGAGLCINGWAAIGAAVVIVLPFDAVHCDVYPDDCLE